MADADIRPVASLLEGLALEHITHEFDKQARASSNGAVAVYERLGFVRSGPMKNDDGVLYNPMATR